MSVSIDLIGDRMTNTQIAVLVKYGVTLDERSMAEFLKQNYRTVQNKESDGEFPIVHHRVAIGDAKRGRRMYDFRDVANWWDQVCGIEVVK